MIIQLLLAHLLVLFLQPNAATTYFVSPAGDDTNSGTLQQPWRTIQFAVDHPDLAPGDTVALMPGLYTEAVRVNQSGVAGAPLTLRSHDPTNPAVLTNDQQDVLTIIDQSHWVIQDLHFDGWACGGIQVRAREADMTDITVADNLFTNNVSWDVCGLSLHVIVAGTTNPNVEVSQVTVRDNVLRDVISGKPTAYNENITFIGNVTDSQIIDNQIFDGSYIGIDLIGRLYVQAAEDDRYHDYGQPHNILIKGNLIDTLKPPEGGGTPVGIYLDGALGPVIIEENIVRHASGIYLNTEWTAWQEGAYLEPTRNIIVRRNQLLVDDASSFGLAMGYETWQNGEECFAYAEGNVALHNTVIVDQAYRTNLFMCGRDTVWKNNIFVHDNEDLANFHDIYREQTPGDGLVLDGNLYYSTTAQQQYWYPEIGGFDSLAAWQAGSDQDLAGIFAPPGFEDAAQGNLTPTENSNAVDAGVALTEAIEDGSRTTQLRVADARYFSNGFGLQPGDAIQIGENSQASVTDVDYAADLLTLDQAMSWQAGDQIAYAYEGAGPDIGAIESPFSHAAAPWWRQLIDRWLLR